MVTYLEAGQPAPAFTAKTVDGKDVKLADYKGKYVLLDFWATWCAPCLAETPNIKAAYDAAGEDPRFVMLALSLDEKASDAAAYIKENQMPGTPIFLPGELENPVVKSFGVDQIPSIWLLGPDGKVIAKDLRGDAIKSAVQTALSRGRAK
jgi:peroxiredoxin